MEDSFERYSENYYDVIVYCHCVLELITRFLKRKKKIYIYIYILATNQVDCSYENVGWAMAYSAPPLEPNL